MQNQIAFSILAIHPSIRVFSNASTLLMRCSKCWSFSISIIPSKEYPGLISFRMDWLDLLAINLLFLKNKVELTLIGKGEVVQKDFKKREVINQTVTSKLLIILRISFWEEPIWDTITVVQARVAAAAAQSLQSCPTLCDPIDGSPPGSDVPGILQARTLEWVAISFSNA